MKSKDKIYRQQIDALKATNEEGKTLKVFEAVSTTGFVTSKKLSKIKDYKLPQDITIPKGFILESVSKKNRFVYHHDDKKLAEKMYEEYDRKLQSKKLKPH